MVEDVGTFWNAGMVATLCLIWNSGICGRYDLLKGILEWWKSGMVEVWNATILESRCSGRLELCYAGIAQVRRPLPAIVDCYTKSQIRRMAEKGGWGCGLLGQSVR